MLIALWNEGLSTAEIGRRLDVTKNAVVGKVHRLGLPKRQSPIRGDAGVKMASSVKSRPSEQPKTAPQPKKVIAAQAPARPKVASEPAPSHEHEEIGTVVSLEHLNHGQCSWPIGDPESEDFRFCGQKVVPGRPYCAYHCAKAYVKTTKKKVDQQDKIAVA